MAKEGKRTVAAWRAAKRGWQPSSICKAEAVLRLAPLGVAEVGRPVTRQGSMGRKQENRLHASGRFSRVCSESACVFHLLKKCDIFHTHLGQIVHISHNDTRNKRGGKPATTDSALVTA